MNWPLDTFLGWQQHARVHTEAASSTWFVTGYDDVAALLADRRLGAAHVADNLTGVPEDLCASVRAIESGFIARWPIFSDPPRHQLLRRAMLPAFHPVQVRAAGVAVRTALATVTPASDFAGLLSQARQAFAAGLATICGFDASAASEALHLAGILMRYLSEPPQNHALVDAADDSIAALTELAMAHIQSSSDPLAQSLMQAHISSGLQPADIAAAYAQLLTGAIEPTTTVLAHALEQMNANPEVAAAYLRWPENVMAEFIRTATPFHFASRHTSQAVQIGDLHLPADSRVVLLLAAANHDARRYTDPHAADPQRQAPPHVAFGRGRHACPGASAATEMIHAALGWLLENGALTRTDSTAIPWHITIGMRTIAAADDQMGPLT